MWVRIQADEEKQHMQKQRVMLMSGFLGSGKTTAMVAMASELESRGKKTALITNDLGSNLVDTSFVAESGYPVLEIADGCLCHDVPQLVDKLRAHMAHGNYDIILFEPVGSCVDMVDHVYLDMRDNYAEEFILAPVTAMVDPVRYQAIYMGRGEDTFSEEVGYGFKKQLEEADLLLISKADTLDGDTIAAIEASLAEEFPGVPCWPVSSIEGIGVDKWADYVLAHETDYRPLDIDMDVIMAGCNTMGWYNWVCELDVPEGCEVASMCMNYMDAVKQRFVEAGAEIAHAKVIASAGGAFCRVAVTSRTQAEPMKVGTLETASGAVKLHINIRAIMDPEKLAQLMEDALKPVLDACGATVASTQLQSFNPACEPPAPICA